MEYNRGRWAISLGRDRMGLGVEIDLDRVFGTVSVSGLLLVIRVCVTFTYNPDTPLRRELLAMLEDDWVSSTYVSVPVDAYDALKADADKWRNPPVESLGRGLDARLADSPPSPDAWFREKAP